MEEKTLFKLARAITDTSVTSVSSKGGTVTYRITSIRRKLVNGKVVSTYTPSCILGPGSVRWVIWGGVTAGNGYLDVKINYQENTGSSRSVTLTFVQDGSGNKINLAVTQESSITYTGYIKVISNSSPSLGSNKGDTAIILVMAYLNGSDGSKKPETPDVGSAPDWCAVSVTSSGGDSENQYFLSVTALSGNQTGDTRSGHIFLTCGDANLSIPITQTTAKQQVNITITMSKISDISARCDITSDQPVSSTITFKLQTQLSPIKWYTYTLTEGSILSRNNIPIQNGDIPQIVNYDYSPREDPKCIYNVTLIQ